MKDNRLANTIKRARIKQHLTLRDVAKLSRGGISNPGVFQLENNYVGTPRPRLLRTVARVLKLDYVRLLVLAGYLTRRDIQGLGK
jgi:transcriptional regulator with XRE-family HTH domain